MADGVVRDVAIAGELVWERAHVARALHVVLAPERIDANALAADVARRHGEVSDTHHHRGALTVLGDAEAVVDGCVATARVQPGCCSQVLGRHAGDRLGRLGAVLGIGDESRPTLERLRFAPLGHEARGPTSPSVTMTCAMALTRRHSSPVAAGSGSDA